MTVTSRVKTPYQSFAENFSKVVNSDILTRDKVKIFSLQTGGGKSYFQGNEMPLVLKKAYKNCKYIFRLAPTREVSDDGTFDNVSNLSNNEYIFHYALDPREDTLKLPEQVPNIVCCYSITHHLFISQFDKLIKYAKDSILIIEEAHQFIGCADKGKQPYQQVTGYPTEFLAKSWDKIKKWRDINPRVIGFTATPTVHHTQQIPSLSDQFIICSDLVDLPQIVPFQSWLKNTHQYHFEKHQGRKSISSQIHNSLSSLFDQEEQLEDKKFQDPNIKSKLTSLYICGNINGIWGCPLSEVKELITNYLVDDLGFDESSKMIATMVEDGGGGCTIWDLEGNKNRVDEQTIIERLNDPNDALRFLIVVDRARSGINVPIFAQTVICRVRKPYEIRTYIPVQIYGRMVRINTGTGDLIRTRYQNNLMKYLDEYPDDYGVPIETVIETLKIANTFDIWYPHNPKSKKTWEESLIVFNDLYVNSAEVGIDWIYDYVGLENPSKKCAKHDELLTDCPWCSKLVKINTRDDGIITLDKFFQ